MPILPAPSSTASRTSGMCSSARAPRDRSACRRWRHRPPAAGALRRRGSQPRDDDWRRGDRRVAGRHGRSHPRDSGRLAPALCRSGRRAADGRGDRSGQGRGRHTRRRIRSRGDGPAGGPRQLRPVGQKARRPARAGHHVDPRDQSSGHRQGTGRREASRLAHPRRDRAGRRTADRRIRPSASRG